MTLQECYAAMGANYNDVLGRLRKEERIRKFLLMALEDSSYDLLCSSLKERNLSEAFRAAHTIKGVSSNLSLTELYQASSELSDVLRNREDYGEDIEPAFERVAQAYVKTAECIRALAQE